MTTLNCNTSALFLGLISTALLAACGGSGGSPTPPAPTPPPVGGIEGSGIAVGTISGFGSIFVNGIEFNTSSASITVDGQSATESQLAVGQVVVVLGSIDDNGVTGTADSVLYDDILEGPVQSIDLATGTLVVLGQTVVTDSATSFDNRLTPASLLGVSVGDVLEISGFPDSAGVIRATRIEPDDDADGFELEGRLTNLDSNAMTFSIAALTVNYAAATLENFPAGAPENGQRVEVHGSTFGGNGELLATRVEFEDREFEVGENDEVEIEGLITRFVSATDFDVLGQAVTTNAQTLFENGTVSDLGLDVKVEAEGSINQAGVLVAEKIDFRRGGDVEIAALVDSVNTNDSTLVLLGITVTVDQLTRFEDKSDAQVRSFSLADLNPGDYVEIRGVEDGAGSSVVAGRLERDDPEGDVILQGVVASVSLPSDFVILGVNVHTTNSTQFRDANDVPISSTDFFANAGGRLVKAKGAWDGSALTATEVAFEN